MSVTTATRMLLDMENGQDIWRRQPGRKSGLSERHLWRTKVTIAAILLVAMVGVLDHFQERSVLVLYVVPVAAVAWRAGRLSAMLVSIAATIAWEIANFPSGPLQPGLLVWDALNRLFVFAGVGVLSELLARESLLARTDALTGLPNRRNLLDRLREARARSRRAPTPFALAYLDVDDFKRLNDAYGHAGGDSALKAVGEAIQQTIRPGDVPARIGGDEFAILFWRLAEDEVEPVTRRMRERIAEAGSAQGLSRLDVSVGMAFFEACPDRTADALDQADRALAQAKAAGKGRVVSVRSGPIALPLTRR